MSYKLTPILMVGCGNMGGALVQGWRASGMGVESIRMVTASEESSQRWASEGYISYVGIHSVPEKFSPHFIILGVKPHQIPDIAEQVSAIAKRSGAIVVSIAAGLELGKLQSLLGNMVSVARVMPNTPVSLRQGICGCIAPGGITQDARDNIHALFSKCATVHWLKHEEDMHTFTALCGSGPAYVFHFMEALRDAAIEYGMDGADADGLARRMVLGASLLACQSNSGLSTLREDVTSKGGTTAAGLAALMEGIDGTTLNRLCDAVIKQASQRSKELAG